MGTEDESCNLGESSSEETVRGVWWIKQTPSGNRTVMDFRVPYTPISLVNESFIRRKYASASADEQLVRCLLANFVGKPGLPVFDVGSFSQQRFGPWRGMKVIVSTVTDFPELRHDVTAWLGLHHLCERPTAPDGYEQSRRRSELYRLRVKSVDQLMAGLKTTDETFAVDYVRVRACDIDGVIRRAANELLLSIHQPPISADEFPVCVLSPDADGARK